MIYKQTTTVIVFGMRIAVTTPDRVRLLVAGAFAADDVGVACYVDGAAYRAFVSPRAQLLHQSPELRDC